MLHAVLHPGPPPPGWAAQAAVVIALVGAAVVAMVVAGSQEGHPAKYFGEGRVGTKLSAGLLLAAAALCVAIALDPQAGALRRFWIVSAVGFAYLSYDDLAMAHENIDRLVHQVLGWDPKNPVTTHLDDAIVAGYGVVAAWWAYRHRALLLQLPWTTSTMAIAFAWAAASVLFDAARDWKTIEESCKTIAEAFIVAALLAARLETRAGRPGTGETARERTRVLS